MLLPDKKQAGAFRPQQPLVPVGSQKIDSAVPHIDRKYTQPLNRIQKEQTARTAAKFRDFLDIDSPAGRISDPAHAEDPRPSIARSGEPIEIDRASVHRHAADL